MCGQQRGKSTKGCVCLVIYRLNWGTASGKMANNSSLPTASDLSTSSGWPVADFELVIQALVLILVLIVTLVGSGLVCYCIFTVRQLQIPTNYFILSLASADFLFAVVCLPFRIMDVVWRYTWKLGTGACTFWVWTDLFFCSASIANLAAISVDRYLKIVAPLTYDTRMTPKRVVVTLVILWGYSLTLASLILVRWSEDPADQARGIIVANQICFIENKIFLTIVSVIGFFAPFAIMLLMYCFVFKVAVSQAKRLVQQQQSISGRSRKGQRSSIFFEVKATKTLVILLSAFCVCWSPYFVLSLISLHSPDVFAASPPWLNRLLKIVFVNLLPNCNAALNPIIYTIHNLQFRKAVQKIIRRHRQNYNSRNFSSTYSEEMTEMRRRSSLLRTAVSWRFSTSGPASPQTAR